MPIENLNGIDIYYEVHGTGEPIVLIMGLGSQSTQWFKQVPVLSKEFQVILFDNRGVGKTARPNQPYTMNNFVNDTIALLNHLNIESANICGISMGGMISLQLVLAHPQRVKRLILLATSSKATNVDTLLKIVEQGQNLPLKVQAKGAVRVLFSREYSQILLNDQSLWDEFMRRYTENPTTLQDFRNQASAIRHHDVRDRLQEIHKPTLIMVGTNDMLLPPNHSRFIGKRIPNAELVVLKGPGHGLTIEAAEKVNSKILEFLHKSP